MLGDLLYNWDERFVGEKYGEGDGGGSSSVIVESGPRNLLE